MISNIREVVTRGAKVLGIAIEGDEDAKEVCDDIVYIPRTNPLLTPVLSVVPLQLIAYYMAKQKACDVDKPRNLAKSVTVEQSVIKGEIIMREELIKTLLNEYKETKKALELGIDWLNEKDYAKGKLDLVNVIIADLEKLSKEV